MSDFLCISVTLLDQRFHGRGDGGEPEWPPSPLRLFQAIVAANAARLERDEALRASLQWLERQPPPLILAPRCVPVAPYCLSVPNNAMDIVGRAWSRGVYDGGGDANPATHRTMKDICPVRMSGGDTLHYVWPIDQAEGDAPLEHVIAAARRLFALGWGIDMAVGDAKRISWKLLQELVGEQWWPCASSIATQLRSTASGTLTALRNRHAAFLDRVGKPGFAPVPPLTAMHVTGYRCSSDPVGRPCIVFRLERDDQSLCQCPQRRIIEVAGMVRHVAKEAMLKAPPQGVPADWVERYVAGHRDKNNAGHRQLSYVPLLSIGHQHADQAVRRVMIIAPPGDEELLEHLARRLQGVRLVPERGDEFGDQEPPILQRVHSDKVARRYTAPANRWASVTPVILPGHNDRKAGKTIKLIERALSQSGIEQPCDFEWSPFSRFRKSLSAHKYDHRGPEKGRIGYIKPPYLQNLSAVHLTITFKDELQVPGPLIIGAGRHCGFGLMAAID